MVWLDDHLTHGPPVLSPLSVASFLFRSAISLSFLAAVVAARLVSILDGDEDEQE